MVTRKVLIVLIHLSVMISNCQPKEASRKSLEIIKSTPIQEVHITSRKRYQQNYPEASKPPPKTTITRTSLNRNQQQGGFLPTTDTSYYGLPLPISTPPQPPAPPPESVNIRTISAAASLVPQPPAPPPDEFLYGPQSTPFTHEEGYYYRNLPALETNHEPSATELTKIINVLTSDKIEGPPRGGRLFYNTNTDNNRYQYVKTVPLVRTYPRHEDPGANDGLLVKSPTYARPVHDPQVSVDNDAITVEAADISCYQTPTRTQFRAVLVPSRALENPPVFEHRVLGRCEHLPRSEGKKYFIDMNNNLDDCGVTTCPENGEIRLCVALRFPSVRGIKLPEDQLMTIQCRTQDRVIEQNKQIRINTEGRTESRSAPVLAVGGLRYDFQSQMALFRRPASGTGFTQRMSAGSAVQLGEEIQLRCDIRSGDGWQYSRLGDVTVHRATQDGFQTQDSVVLVNSDGCRNPLMKSVCPDHPQRDRLNALSTSMTWRAFMFQDMREGEEVVVSARLLGCLEAGDCNPDVCYDHSYSNRVKRSAGSTNHSVRNWVADLSFRVVLPNGSRRHVVKEDWMLPALSAGICLLTVLVVLVMIFIFKTFLFQHPDKEQAAEYLNIKWPTRFDCD